MTKIYLQTHKVAENGLPSNRGPGVISTSKNWIKKQENWDLVFLITSGTLTAYRQAGFNKNLPVVTPASKRIYLLWDKFEIEHVSRSRDGDLEA